MELRDPDRWRDALAGSVVPIAPARPTDDRTAPGAAHQADAPVVPHAERAPDTGLAGRGLAAILDAFLTGVVSLVGARAGLIRSLTPDGSGMRVVAMTGLPEAVSRREAVAGCCGVCADALRCSDLRVAHDEQGCGEIASDGIFDGIFAGDSRGAVAVPLDYAGRTVGVFTLFFDGVRDLRAEVIHLMRPIGQLVGVTLENAKLEHEQFRASLIQERQTMAGEIHDSLAQSLTFARMRMPLLHDAIAEKETARALKYCRDLYDELGNANRRLRALITHFRAGMDAQGLLHALHETTAGFFERTGIALAFENRAPDLGLTVEAEVQVFHVVQEALANIHRHSRARHATVVSERVDGHAVITIEDDGVGWDAMLLERVRDETRSNGAHFGLAIMRERAQAAGGRLELGRSASGGARLRLSVPLADSAKVLE